MAPIRTTRGGTLTTRGSSASTNSLRRRRSAYQRERTKYNARSGNSPTAQRLRSRSKEPGNTSVRNAAERTAQSKLKPTGHSAVNTVTSGAGSQRQGQTYRHMTDASGAHYHVYGSGPKAKKVKLSDSVAKAYGYTSGGTKAPKPAPPRKRNAAKRRLRHARGGTLTTS